MSVSRLIKIQELPLRLGRRKEEAKTRQLSNMTAAGALGGTFWGMLFGLIFFVPLLGAAIGAGIGALAGSMTDAASRTPLSMVSSSGSRPAHQRYSC